MSEVAAEIPHDALAALAEAILHLAVSSVILGAIAAAVLLFLHEVFFLRSVINTALLAQTNYKILGEFPWILREPGLRGLPYRQLCGQLSARAALALQRETSSDFKPQYFPDDDGTQRAMDERYHEMQERAQRLEAEISNLQQRLGSWWLRINYISSIVLIVVVLALIPNDYGADAGDGFLVAIVVAALAALLAPLFLQVLERYFSAR